MFTACATAQRKSWPLKGAAPTPATNEAFSPKYVSSAESHGQSRQYICGACRPQSAGASAGAVDSNDEDATIPNSELKRPGCAVPVGKICGRSIGMPAGHGAYGRGSGAEMVVNPVGSKYGPWYSGATHGGWPSRGYGQQAMVPMLRAKVLLFAPGLK
jgi:hypothetical protein